VTAGARAGSPNTLSMQNESVAGSL